MARNNRIVFSVLVAAWCMSMCFISVAHADVDSATVDAKAQNIFDTVMSPYCPGRLLQDCPSGQAAELRDKIRGQLKTGESEDEIKQDLYNSFGTELRASPENTGFGALAWWMPIIFVLIGLGGLIAWLRATRGVENVSQEEMVAAISPELQTRIDRETKSFNE